MQNISKNTQPSAPDTGKETDVIRALNKARGMELHSLSQYMDQHYSLDNWDYGELAVNIKLISIDEMRHAELFAERIKELDGIPTHTPASLVEKGQVMAAIYPFDSHLEAHTMDEYNKFKIICTENGDSVSARLFEKIIAEELIHFTYFTNVAKHMEELGNTYLAKLAGTSSSGSASKGFV